MIAYGKYTMEKHYTQDCIYSPHASMCHSECEYTTQHMCLGIYYCTQYVHVYVCTHASVRVCEHTGEHVSKQ